MGCPAGAAGFFLVKTYAPKPRDIERRWYVMDADGVVLGRLATVVAGILRGKHKPIFAPHADTGDHVVIVNARGVRLTGGKETKKIAYRHSGYPGGLKEVDYATLLATRPSKAVEKAVRGMLPKNRLGRAMLGKLKVYDGPEHPHTAQRPAPLALGEVPKWEGLPERPAPEPVAEAKKPAARKPAAKKAPAKKPTPERGAAKPAVKRTAAKRTTKVAAKAGKPAGKKAPKKREES